MLAGAAVTWAFVPNVDWVQPRIWLILGGVVATVAVPLITWGHDYAEQQENARLDEVEVEAFAVLQGYLSPALVFLSKMAMATDESSAGQELARLQSTISNAARNICGPQDSSVRCVIFEAKNQTMSQVAWIGSTAGSRREFVNRKTDGAGPAAWKAAETGEPVLWADLTLDAPHGFAHGERPYATFITCGVVGPNREVYGMLNVDALAAGVFTEFDRRIVGLLAKVLASGYAIRSSVVSRA